MPFGGGMWRWANRIRYGMSTLDRKLAELRLRPRDGIAYHPLTEKQVVEFERILGARLPRDYRAFISKYGDSFFTDLVEVAPVEPPPAHIAGDGRPSFGSFFGSDAMGLSELKERVRIFEGRMLPDIFSFGCDLWSNQFCLGVRGKDRGKVYLYDFHGEPAEEDYTDRGEPVPKDLWYQNLTLLARSFTDFIDRIRVRVNE